jgi:hypothetical protein
MLNATEHWLPCEKCGTDWPPGLVVEIREPTASGYRYRYICLACAGDK